MNNNLKIFKIVVNYYKIIALIIHFYLKRINNAIKIYINIENIPQMKIILQEKVKEIV